MCCRKFFGSERKRNAIKLSVISRTTVTRNNTYMDDLETSLKELKIEVKVQENNWDPN